jgi:hypothetical protein
MASPTAIGETGLGATAAGSALSAYGAYETGTANSRMYGYQAQVAQINSKIALQNADYARMQGEQQAVIAGRKGAQQFGGIRAAEGASGLDVNSGSSTQVQASQKSTTALDMTQIRSNAAKVAYDYTTQSTEDISQAGLYNMAASNAKTAGDIGALTSIVGGAGSVSSKWLQGQQEGLWGNGSGSFTASSDSAIY